METIDIPSSLLVADFVPTDARYWVDSEADLNKGYVHEGMLRFVKGQKALYIKLDATTWTKFAIGVSKADAGTITVRHVSTGPTAKVTNVGTATDAILDFVLPPGPEGKAATIESVRLELLEPGQPGELLNQGTLTNAQLVLRIPRPADGAKGEKGEDFRIIGRGTFAGRSAYDAAEFGADTTYLVVDATDTARNGLIYFKNEDGTWSDGVGFTGQRGWTPRLAMQTLNPTTIVLAVTDWTGGEGDKPEIPADGYYLGSAGFTTDPSQATNLFAKGEQGDQGNQGRAFLVDAQGPTAAKALYDAEGYPFNFLDTTTSLVHQKLPDNSWGSPWAIAVTAYEIWRAEGHVGSRADFLASLKAQDGYTPVKGVDYFDGQDGQHGYTPVKGTDYVDGQDGQDGRSAYEIWLEAGNVGTEADYLAALKGAKGDPGPKGDPGDPLNADLFVRLTDKATPNGVASLDGDGRVPMAQLPSLIGSPTTDWNITGDELENGTTFTMPFGAHTTKLYIDGWEQEAQAYTIIDGVVTFPRALGTWNKVRVLCWDTYPIEPANAQFDYTLDFKLA